MRRNEGVGRRNRAKGFPAHAEIEMPPSACSETVYFGGKIRVYLVFEPDICCAQPGSSMLFFCAGKVPLVSEIGGVDVGRLGSDCRPGVRCLPAMCLRKCRLALGGSPTPQPTACQQRASTPGGANLPVDPVWIRMAHAGPCWLVKSGVAFFCQPFFSADHPASLWFLILLG